MYIATPLLLTFMQERCTDCEGGDTVNDDQEDDTQVESFTCRLHCDIVLINLLYLQTSPTQMPLKKKISGTDVIICFIHVHIDLTTTVDVV